MTANRGTTTQRGYDNNHKKLRADIQKRMDAGEIFYCWRDGKPIQPGEPWHLGHDDNDRTKYNGPEHQACNTGAPHRKSHINPCDTSRNW